MNLSQVFYTARYLRPEQVWGRFVFKMRRLLERPAFAVRRSEQEAGRYPGLRWAPGRDFPAPAGGARLSAADITQGGFRFVGFEAAVGFPPEDWEALAARDQNGHPLSHLWRYNLHYFEWLWALDYEHARAAVLDWINRHEPGGGGWDPYPTALRLMNWCAVLFDRFRSQTETDADLLDRLWPSVFAQTRWLETHLEFHLMGNHLLEDAAALAFVGSCFEADHARRWRERGLQLLRREIDEQILPDGMHFERSPMYHARMTYLMLLLCRTGDEHLADVAREPLRRMLSALDKVTHPDGRIALLNDAAFDVYNEPAELRRAAASCFGEENVPLAENPTGAWSLPEAGYYGFRSEGAGNGGGPGDYVICDAGPIGPDYIPGHAHGDIFSFELSLGGERVIVDSGVHDYEPGEMRYRDRSTQAHNTVEIEGRDQCEFWAAFRVARRGRPRDVRFSPLPEGFDLEGWHDGYTRLPGAPRHRRRFIFRTGRLSIEDHVGANRPVLTALRFHLHPSCEIVRISSHRAVLARSGRACAIQIEGPGDISVEHGRYSPRFGECRDTKVLLKTARGRDIRWRTTLSWPHHDPQS